jgi:hypothetical protein
MAFLMNTLCHHAAIESPVLMAFISSMVVTFPPALSPIFETQDRRDPASSLMLNTHVQQAVTR